MKYLVMQAVSEYNDEYNYFVEGGHADTLYDDISVASKEAADKSVKWLKEVLSSTSEGEEYFDWSEDGPIGLFSYDKKKEVDGILNGVEWCKLSLEQLHKLVKLMYAKPYYVVEVKEG